MEGEGVEGLLVRAFFKHNKSTAQTYPSPSGEAGGATSVSLSSDSKLNLVLILSPLETFINLERSFSPLSLESSPTMTTSSLTQGACDERWANQANKGEGGGLEQFRSCRMQQWNTFLLGDKLEFDDYHSSVSS